MQMTLAFTLYTIGILTAVWCYVRNIRREAEMRRRLEMAEYKVCCHLDCPRLNQANERLHAISDSALRGAPVVRFTHPPPVPPTVDPWYYRVRMEAHDHLFTEEAVREARQRALLLIPAKHTFPQP
jgi:hypothetical protein